MKPEKTNPETAHSVPTPGEFLAAGDKSDHTSAELVNECDRLQWLAFCYVTDELTAGERADFESRLSTELKAQEALASVVELGCGVYENYQLQTASHEGLGSTLLDRAGTKSLPADRSSTLSRMLLVAAAILVLAVIGYGLVPNSNHITAHNSHQDQSPASPSASQSSILADEWINGLDEELVVVSVGELPNWDSEEFDESMISSEVDDLRVDASLISFYSEMLDDVQEEALLNSRSTRKKTGVEL